jgi:hypothetical protein
MVDTPCISSFVIRIIEEPDSQLAASPYRGMIRHVQSDQELSFTNWADVEAFIQCYVPIHRMGSAVDASRVHKDPEEVQGDV